MPAGQDPAVDRSELESRDGGPRLHRIERAVEDDDAALVVGQAGKQAAGVFNELVAAHLVD